MLKLLKFANALRGKMESAKLDRAAAQPQLAQNRLLSETLRKNVLTVFGKAHNFTAIKSVKDFQRQIPLRDYEDFRPFINRLIKGEKSVLTAENPFMFTLTSGTTDEPKYIPVNREAQTRSAALMRQWLFRAESDHRGLTAHSSVGIVSQAVEGYTAGGLPFGSTSGVIYQNIPSVVRRAYAVPYAVSEIADYDRRYFVLARFALGARVSLIATPNPSTLLRLAEVCRKDSEQLIRAIHDGTLGIELPEHSKVYEQLAESLKPNPPRARRLAQIIGEKGFLQLADCWGDLKMIGCWLGGSVGLQAAKLAEIFGAAPLRDLGYLASEGHFTLPAADANPAGMLALENNFYEFVPESEIESAAPTVLTAEELEDGKRYAVVLTTAAGLYRYKINDIIEVSGFCRRTPLISFVRKTGEAANITGEKMHANHLVSVFEKIGREFNLPIEQFRAVPNFDECRYEIFLELKTESSTAHLRRILDEIDARLQIVNLEYAQKRRSKRLHAPTLSIMKRGWANAGLRRHLADGKRDTQYKPTILARQKDSFDESFISAVIEHEAPSAALEKLFV